MLKEAIATASTVDEARNAAALQLGELADNADVQYEIIDLPQKKTFGLFGGCPAKVRAYIDIPDPVVKKPAEPKTNNRAPKTDDQKPKTENQRVKAENQRVKAESQRVNTENKPDAPRAQDAKNESRPRKNTKPADRTETNTPRELAPFTEDTKKKAAEAGQAYLKTIFDCMQINVEMSAGQTENGAEIVLSGDNLGVIVGRRGETLDALQYLTVLAANKGENDYQRVTLNTGNYREKREMTLKALARRMANQALRNGRNATLEPMNPYERRIIHTAVQDIKGVTSWSVGDEPMRRVIIGAGRGERSGYNRGGRPPRRDDRAPRRTQTPASPVSSASSASDTQRTPKKDIDAPLYGKIERKN